MSITIVFLKEIARSIYNVVHPILGSEEAARKLRKGAGGDISMQIDIIAENMIIEKLKEYNCDIQLISEEIGEIYIGDENKALKTGARLIVDPVDGSNNAVRGIPFSSVSIAYAEGNELESIIKAVIIDLYTGDLYWAEKGKGAFLNEERIQVSNLTFGDDTIFEIDYKSEELVENLIKYQSIIEKIYRARVMGSSALSLCLLAKGCIDGFLDLRKGSRIIDIAAGILIVKEAGGKIFSKNGGTLQSTLQLDAEVPIVASNAKLEPILKEELKKINRK